MKPGPAIQLDGLTKRYGKTVVVDSLTLEVTEGTIFGFLGPNGSGKSTTIKMLTGLVVPDAGQALIMGRSVLQDPVAVKRSIGVVPDGLALFEYLSIWEHLELVGSSFDLDAQAYAVRSAQLLKLLDLTEAAHQLARRCSYGMRKKTALAMALLPSPKVLILDEPFEGLDPVMTVVVKRALQRAAGAGVTVFITTHVLGAVDDLIQQYGILRAGKLVARGDTADLQQQGLTLQEAYLREFDCKYEDELLWLS